MSEIEAVRAGLPAWLVWSAGLPLVPLGFAVGAAAAYAAARSALPRPHRLAALHWTERARLTWPGRLVAPIVTVAAALFVAGVLAARPGPLSVLPPVVVTALAAAAAYLGGTWASERIGRWTTGRREGWLATVRATLLQLLLLCPQLFVVVALATTVGAPFDRFDLLASGLGVALYLALSLGAGMRLARRCGALEPASSRLRTLVERAAARCGVAPRAVHEVTLPMVNAFAIPPLGWLVFTRRALDALDDAQLESVALHELGHLAEPRAIVASRVALSFAMLPLGFTPALVQALGPMTGLLAVYAGYFAMLAAGRALSRRMERRADGVACGHEEDAGAFAAALERIHELNLAPATGRGAGGTHPDLYDRLLAAGVTPDYPRPAPPDLWRYALGVLAGCGVLVAAWGALDRLAGWEDSRSEPRVLAVMALSGGSARDLFDLAAHARDPAWALRLLGASLALEPRDHAAQALRATRLARLGRCDAADAALASARQELGDRHALHASECPWLRDALAAVAVCEPRAGALHGALVR